jgi:hypothetical protein
MNCKKFYLLNFLCLFLCSLIATSTQAQDIFWTGAGDGNS